MTTTKPSDTAREARDYLGDLTDLLGLTGPVSGPLGVRFDITPGEARQLADVLLSGVLARQLRLTPDAPVWCTRHDGVAAVVRIARHEVTLRSVEYGDRWDVMLSEIRTATLAEIRAADMPPARQVTP
jgi:hypothetical protein